MNTEKLIIQSENPTTKCDRIFALAPQVGLEPTTTRLTAECSTD